MKGAPAGLVQRYARSLFSIALERNIVDPVLSDLEALSDALRHNPEFAALILNPSVSPQRARSLVGAIGKKIGFNPLTTRFVDLLIEKDRVNILHSIAPAFAELLRKHKGEVNVTVTTAVQVSEPMQKQITSHLAKSSGKTPLVMWKIDPAVLGGLIVEWPDKIVDSSLARKIENMKTTLAGQA